MGEVGADQRRETSEVPHRDVVVLRQGTPHEGQDVLQADELLLVEGDGPGRPETVLDELTLFDQLPVGRGRDEDHDGDGDQIVAVHVHFLRTIHRRSISLGASGFFCGCRAFPR